MKNSLKKLSMLAMLGVVIGSNLNATGTNIKVINLPKGSSIAAQVPSGNAVQKPVNGYYLLDSDHNYYAIIRTPATKNSPGSDRFISNTSHLGSDFIGKNTWNISTNIIS